MFLPPSFCQRSVLVFFSGVFDASVWEKGVNPMLPGPTLTAQWTVSNSNTSACERVIR